MNSEEWKKELSRIKVKFLSALENCGAGGLADIEIEYLGRKGGLSGLLRDLKNFSIEEKKELGRLGNKLKSEMSLKLEERKTDFEAQSATGENLKSDIDLTLPGKTFPKGNLHPITRTTDKIVEELMKLGFSMAGGPFIENEYNNFEALNIPEYHPSRDMQDTFYINLSGGGKNLLMRTHTSPVQIRTMKKQDPPLRIISPGRAFRRDAVDASHSFVFHQIEGLYIDKAVSMADLKWTLETFIKALFGSSSKIRFRPSYFPFVEPGAEVDMFCVFCQGKKEKCSVCKGTGWIEVLGAGLVHPNVLKNVEYDPEKWKGFAFGAGIERFAMLLYGIEDMRILYENDLRILKRL